MIEQIKKLIFDDELIEKLADTVMNLQSKENTVLPLLKKRFADTQKSIDNMLDAIQQGILTASTKERLESLEKQKSELSVRIIKEKIAKPTLSREQIIFWFHRFRKLNTKRLDHRRRLIDSFVNAIFLYDDRITFTFNYKDGTKTINFTELEKSGLGSDIKALAAPKMTSRMGGHFFRGADLNSEFRRNSDGSGRAENEGRGVHSQGSLRRSPFSSGASAKTSPRRVFARLISPAPQKALKTLSFQGFFTLLNL